MFDVNRNRLTGLHQQSFDIFKNDLIICKSLPCKIIFRMALKIAYR